MADTERSAAFNSAADKLLAAHDGDVALLYIYIRRFKTYSQEDAAQTLCRTLRDIQAAEEKLRRMGLWPNAEEQPSAAPAKLLPEDKSPAYTAADLQRRASEDPQYAAILAEGERVLGRMLSAPEMGLFLEIYDHIGLPAEVVHELLHFCREKHPNRLPFPREIRSEAYVWANHEIFTLEQAEEYIRRHKERTEAAGRIRKALGIQDRPLSPTEKKYIDSWLDMGFGEDAVVLAYDKTVTNTGAYRIRYMDGILRGWHGKGLHSPEEIRGGDERRSPSGGAKPASRKALDELFNKI